MDIFYYTFGCKVNQYETENIKERFMQKSHRTVTDHTQADLCIINTCTVTSEADRKCRQLVRKIRRDNPQCIIALAGCFVQAFKKQAEQMTECDIIAGTADKVRLPELVDSYITSGSRIISITPHLPKQPFDSMVNTTNDGKTRAYIKIQDGCDRYCSYCIIPYARGHIRSKPVEVIKKEVAELAASGHKEIILTGINLCFYGKDLEGGVSFADAVEAACNTAGDFRVRLGSLEPEMMTDEDITRLGRLEKLCPHFHLSLQSGCDETLRRMNRHYTANEYAELCIKLRKAFPDCAITTDIMVGFPMERDEEFERSLKFAEDTAFAEAHIFPYSRRAGTVADRLGGQVDKSTKHARAAKMAEVCGRTKADYLSSCVGRTLKVLFERETDALWHTGHADNYVTVRVRRDDPEVSLWKTFRMVRITSSDGKVCYGELV